MASRMRESERDRGTIREDGRVWLFGEEDKVSGEEDAADDLQLLWSFGKGGREARTYRKCELGSRLVGIRGFARYDYNATCEMHPTNLHFWIRSCHFLVN